MMHVSLSQRRAKFYGLLRAANDQSTEWLIAFLLDPALIDTPDHRRTSRLSRLACLRVLACRDRSGQPYPVRKRVVREMVSWKMGSMAKFKVGDTVNWTNDYGVKFPERQVVGVEYVAEKGHRYFLKPHDAHWMSIPESQLVAEADDPVVEVVCGQKIRTTHVDGEVWFLVGANASPAFKFLEAARHHARSATRRTLASEAGAPT